GRGGWGGGGAGVGPGGGGDGGGGGAGAVRAVVPERLGHIRRAAAARGAPAGLPDPLGPAAGVAGPGELGAANGGYRVEVRGEARGGEPVVAGSDDDGVPGVVIGAGVGLAEPGFPDAVAVGDDLGAEPGGSVLGGGQVRDKRWTGLHDQDLAARAGGRPHRHAQGLLRSPAARVGYGQRGGVAVLVDDPQAPGAGGARGQAIVVTVGGQVGGQARGAVGVHDRHRLVRVTRDRQLVRGLD